MTRVLKYELLPPLTKYMLPVGSRPRFVHEQRDRLFLWFETPEDDPLTMLMEVRAFRVIATGESFDDGRYIGTATMDDASLIWHVYEVPA